MGLRFSDKDDNYLESWLKQPLIIDNPHISERLITFLCKHQYLLKLPKRGHYSLIEGLHCPTCTLKNTFKVQYRANANRQWRDITITLEAL